MDNEKHQYKHLTYQELIHLRAIYNKRLIQVNKQLSRLIDGEVLGIKTYDIIKSYDYKSKLLEDESMIISEELSKIWKDFGSTYSYDTLSYVLASCILNKYNYEFNPYITLEKNNIDIEQYYRLYLKIFEWLNENYWKK